MKSMLVLIKAKNQPLKPTMFHFNISTSETNGKKKNQEKHCFSCVKKTQTQKKSFFQKKKKNSGVKQKCFSR